MALGWPAGALAQEVDPGADKEPVSPATLRVGLTQNEPFVIIEGKKYSGLAVDLFEHVAPDLRRPFQFEVFESMTELLDATAGGKIDVAVANVTITEQRAQRVDFTQPWYDGGLRLMVRRNHGDLGLGSVVQGLVESGHLRHYALIAGGVVVGSFLLMLFYRRFDQNFPKGWRNGLAEGFYGVMSVVTTGKTPNTQNYFGWLGRIWQGLWLVCGVAILAFVTSSVTSVMTTTALKGRISNVHDIGDQPVGAVQGLESYHYGVTHKMAMHAYRSMEEAVAALTSGEINAIIGDAHTLEYYSFSHPAARVKVVGASFQPEKYGYALPPESPLRRQLNVSLLRAQEEGTTKELATRYFGK